MIEHEFQCELWLHEEPDKVFSFFADAANLDAITPSWLHFETLTPLPIHMREGELIDYRLRVHGFPLRWRTRINEWSPPTRFVDEQIHGPYRLWIHTHTFQSRNGGTLVRDHVRYATPLDALLHRWVIRRDIERIFKYRTEALRKRVA
jgi:ligand-binding SRPBCC domain-containing protein